MIQLDENGRVVELAHPINILSPKAVGPLGAPGQVLSVSADGTRLEWATSAASGNITGSGANSEVAYWSGASTLTGDPTFFWQTGNQRLVIGRTTPLSGLTARLQLFRDGAQAGITVVGWGATDQNPFYGALFAHGSDGSESPILANDIIFDISANGWAATLNNFISPPPMRIAAYAAENWDSAVGYGNYWEFVTTPTASTTRVGAVRMHSFGVGLKESTAPGTPPTDWGSLYTKTDGKLYWKNDAGTEYDLTDSGGGGTVTGTGSSGRVAYWSGASSLTSDVDLTFNGTTLTLGSGGNTFPTARNLDIDATLPTIGFAGLSGDPYSIGLNLASLVGLVVYNDGSDNWPLFIDNNDNVGLNSVAAFGASAAGVLAMKNAAAAPSAAVTDQFHLYAKDAAAGKSWPTFRAEDNTERFVVGVSGTGNSTTNVRTLNGSTLTAQTGYLTLHDHQGVTVYVPYFSAV